MHRFHLIVLAILAAFSTQAQQLQTSHSAWWTHVEALANDGMEGRNTGSAGHKRAAEYVAAQFQKSGLEPAGASGGFIQPVKFNTRRIDESKSSLALITAGAEEKLTLGDDANISMRV